MSLLLGGLGGGLMCRIKTPQQDYALKMQGGGGIFAGHYDLFLVVLETLCTSSLQSYVQVL